MFRLTLKDFLSIIGSINTCVPTFSLSLSLSISLSPSVHTIVIWTLRIVAASSHLLCVWCRLTLSVLASIICNHNDCLSSVFVYIYIYLYAILSFEYIIVRHVSEPYFFIIIIIFLLFLFCLLLSGFGSDFKIIISLYFFFLLLLLLLPPPPPHTHTHTHIHTHYVLQTNCRFCIQYMLTVTGKYWKLPVNENLGTYLHRFKSQLLLH